MTSKTISTLAALLSMSASAFAADVPAMQNTTAVSADKTWEASWNTDLRLWSFSATRGFVPPTNGSPLVIGRGSGSQFYIPTAFFLNGFAGPDIKIETSIRSGYVSSQQNTPGLSGSYSGQTDTVVSGTVKYLGIPGFQPYVSVSSNIPTGKALLHGPARFARMDPDLVDLSTMGQGFTIGPTVGVNFPVSEKLTFSVGAGYTIQNAFWIDITDPLTLAETNVYKKPANSASVNANVVYKDGPLTLQGSVVYTTQSTIRENGAPFLRFGDSYSAQTSASYAFTEFLTATLSGTVNYTEKSDLPNNLFGGVLITERFNRNSTVYRIGLDAAYRVTDTFQIGPIADWKYRDRNTFSPVDMLFVPAKTRWAAGVQASWQPLPNFSIQGLAQRIWVRQSVEADKFNATAPPPFLLGSGTLPISSDGWLVTLGGTVTF
jgi:hypothetical protein